MKKILAIGSAAVIAFLALLFTLGGEPNTDKAPLRSSRAGERLAEPLTKQLALASNAPPPAGGPIPAVDELNATQILSEKIAKELLAKNPNGPSFLNNTKQIVGVSPDDLIDQALGEELERLGREGFGTGVKTSDLRLADDTREAEHAFAAALNETLNPFVRSSIPVDDLAPETFAPFADLGKATTVKLSALAVPARLAPLLANTIRIIGAYASVFAGIAESEIDPLKAMIALQAWQPIKQELERFYRQEITSLLAQNGIN